VKRNTYAPLKACAITGWLVIGYLGLGFPLPLPVVEEPSPIMMAFTPKGESRLFEGTLYQIGSKARVALIEGIIVDRENPTISIARYVRLAYSWDPVRTAAIAEPQAPQRRSKQRRRA